MLLSLTLVVALGIPASVIGPIACGLIITTRLVLTAAPLAIALAVTVLPPLPPTGGLTPPSRPVLVVTPHTGGINRFNGWPGDGTPLGQPS